MTVHIIRRLFRDHTTATRGVAPRSETWSRSCLARVKEGPLARPVWKASRARAYVPLRQRLQSCCGLRIGVASSRSFIFARPDQCPDSGRRRIGAQACVPKRRCCRTCICPATLTLGLTLGRIVSTEHSLTPMSSVLWGRRVEGITSRYRVRVGRNRRVQWLLWLRGRGIAVVGLRRRRLAVWIMDHRVIWGSLERRRRRLAVHGDAADFGSSRRRSREQKVDGTA